MYSERRNFIGELEKSRNSRVILYATGDKSGWETQIAPDSFDPFVNHLDSIGVTGKISLVLYTQGGNTLAAWSIVNLIKQFCDDFEILVPHTCRSAGTLMVLGATRVVMTKQATLGPIDPSVNGVLNPMIAGNPNARAPVSVEGIQGFITLAKEELGIKEDKGLAEILVELSRQVHPLVLGEVIRARSQIQMLARKLIIGQVQDAEKVEEIVRFLTSDSGSHDYTINRREAAQLGLNVEKPDAALYAGIKSLYDDLKAELELGLPFDPAVVLNSGKPFKYKLKRVIIESLSGGSDYFISEGEMSHNAVNPAAIDDRRDFEGWKRDAP